MCIYLFIFFKCIYLPQNDHPKITEEQCTCVSPPPWPLLTSFVKNQFPRVKKRRCGNTNATCI